jgi:hypothetical protein
LVIYYLIFVMAVCIALSYALVVLFEVGGPPWHLVAQAPMVHLEKLLYWSLGLAKLPSVRREKKD